MSGAKRARPTVEWASLPAAQQLEVCAFLDPLSLGCLELCGSRQFEEARARAWKQAAEGTPRGVLATLPSDKKFLAAHTQLRSLYPTSMRHAYSDIMDIPRDDEAHSLFEDFAFTFAISWEDDDGCFRTAAFEHMRCNDPRLMKRTGHISEFMYAISDDAPGHDALTPILLASQEGFLDADDFPDYWRPIATQYCTRKRDGVTIKIARWGGVTSDINEYSDLGPNRRLGSISFESGLVWLEHGQDVDETESTLNLLFEKNNGRLRAFGSSLYDDAEEVHTISKSIFRALLLAKFEDATADKPPAPRTPLPLHGSQWRPGDVHATGLTRDYTHL